jgi:hypothetical protein
VRQNFFIAGMEMKIRLKIEKFLERGMGVFKQ